MPDSNLWLLASMALPALVSALSCGGATSDEATGAEPIPLDELASAVANALCQPVADCCEGTSTPFDVETCKADVDPAPKWNRDTFTYNAQAAGDCLALIEEYSYTRACTAERVELPEPEACQRVFSGKTAPGAPCAFDDECRHAPGESVECAPLDILGEGTEVCILRRNARAGEECRATCEGSWCQLVSFDPTSAIQGRCNKEDGLYCSSAGKCERLSATGERCDDDLACASDSYCDDATDTCKRSPGEGEDCDSSNCREGLYCNEKSRCSRPLPVGSPCAWFNECEKGLCDTDQGKCVSDPRAVRELLCAARQDPDGDVR